MPAPTTVDQILADMEQRHEKTASTEVVTQPAEVAAARSDLDAALAGLQGSSSVKTAAAYALSGQDAVAYLEKTAAEIEAAEANALVKEAELFGAAFLHSFISQANEYASAAGTKVAHATGEGQEAVQRIKMASAQGASDMADVLTAFSAAPPKTAAVQGSEEEAVMQVKTAAVQGAKDTTEVLSAMVETSQIKTAAAQGAQDTAEVLGATFNAGVDDATEKLAEYCNDAFNRGYADIDAVVNA